MFMFGNLRLGSFIVPLNFPATKLSTNFRRLKRLSVGNNFYQSIKASISKDGASCWKSIEMPSISSDRLDEDGGETVGLVKGSMPKLKALRILCLASEIGQTVSKKLPYLKAVSLERADFDPNSTP